MSRWVVITLGLAGALLAPRARAGDSFAWTPADHPAIVRGREVGHRFDLLGAWEVVLPVDNAFSAENRRALAALEQRLAGVPGVRKVVGPAGLLDVSVNAAGKISASPLLARGADGAATDETESEAIRQRIVRRADALGWFLSADGRVARLLVYTDDLDRARPAINRAIAGSGVRLSYAGVAARQAPLWPDPRDWVAWYLAAGSAAAWIAFLALLSRRAWRQAGSIARRRVVLAALAAVCGGGAFFALAAVSGVRWDGVRAGGAAGLAVTLALLVGVSKRRGPVPGPAPRPPHRVALAGVLLVAAAALTMGRVRLGTQQWRASPLLFVSVRGELDQPVVLRELRRLTDFLRAEPGVANAWSVADLFFGVQRPGDEVSGIPDSADEVRRLLVHARHDAALRLQLGGNHDEALVAIRFDQETEVDRQDLLERLMVYLKTDLRASLVQVDLNRGGLSAVTRSLAKGLLAADARERILRICARSGRNLGEPEMMSVERVARQAAIFPPADPARLRTEIGLEVRAFVASAGQPIPTADRDRLTAALAAQSADATADEVRGVLAGIYGVFFGPAALDAASARLAARLVDVRMRHAATINFKEMLLGADLPTEGMLAEEVRSATREAMGPVVGVPVARDNPGAFRLDAVAVGGAANDRALSEQWLPGLRAGAIAGAAVIALLLLLIGGGRGLLWWPVALAPAALAILVPALTRDPVGVMFVSFWSGTLAGGVAFAASFAARRGA